MQPNTGDDHPAVSATHRDSRVVTDNAENDRPAASGPKASQPPEDDTDSPRTLPLYARLFRRRNAVSEPSPKKAFPWSRKFKRNRHTDEHNQGGSSKHTRHDSSGSTEPSQSAGISSPDLQAKRNPPDLDAVSAALRALPLPSQEDTQKGPRASNLKALGFGMREVPPKYEDLLREAMHEREQGHADRCRAKCIQVINGKHATVHAKIYAYNILASQAKRKQAERLLKESERLIRENVEEQPDLVRLMGVVRSLRERAREEAAESERNEGG